MSEPPWTPPGEPIEPPRLAIEPERTFYSWDGLDLLFAFSAARGLCLALWLDEIGQSFRYLVVLTTGDVIEALVDGSLAVLDAFQSDEALILDLECVANEWNIVRAWRMKTSDIPASQLPDAGIMLYPEREAS